ncbi:SpoIVB peptidase [Blautia sp. CLA-JM-H16]|uniref:SpoIVB peptidase n=1 Tax=Blautia aquisgranensis TaxID=3133153 RepID=A0ABV1BBM7_9FIRM
MSRKGKYRCLILMFLILDLALMGWMGYRLLDRKIPDQILVDHEDSQEVTKLLKQPFVTFDDAITVSGKDSYTLHCRVLGVIPFKDVKVKNTSAKEVYVSGEAVGIYMQTKGVLIIDTGEILSENGEKETPARDIVKPGDYIVAFNQDKIKCKQDLLDELAELDEKEVTLKVRRGKETIPLSVTPVKDKDGEYKLGIWVRDDTQGIGTLTFVDENGRYGALGHGISDVDTGELLSIADGKLYNARILGVRKGEKGNPGEISGLIRYDSENILGNISENSKNGIFGTFRADQLEAMNLEKISIGYKQDLKTGPASILCSTDGEVKEYAAEITRIDMNHEDTNKSFVIQVTDKELLEKTGGIVQGMSGSPVIQNGKLFGAVTHVFVQDATGGYGIFIENMMKYAE